jgi:hypothetical protein
MDSLQTLHAQHGATQRVRTWLCEEIAKRQWRRNIQCAGRILRTSNEPLRLIELTDKEPTIKGVYANLNEDGSISIHGFERNEQ